MKICYFFGFIILFQLIGCSNQTDKFIKATNLQKELTLTKVGEYELQKADGVKGKMIGRLRPGFAKHFSKNIYAFYDAIFNRFLITKEENIIAIIGGKGRGPKEFLYVNSYSFDQEGNLVVFDTSLKMIKVFSISGKLLQSFKIDPDKTFSITSSSIIPIQGKYYFPIIKIRFLANLENAWRSALIGGYNSKGKIIDTLGIYDPYIKNPNTYELFPVINFDYSDNLFFSSQTNSYRVQIYDLKTERRIAYFGYKSEHFKETEDPIKPRMSRLKIMKLSLGQSFTTGVYTTSKYIILCFQNVTESWHETKNPKEKRYYLAIYNRKAHAFIDELLLTYPLLNIVDNKIYLLQNGDPDNYILGIYELEN